MAGPHVPSVSSALRVVTTPQVTACDTDSYARCTLTLAEGGDCRPVPGQHAAVRGFVCSRCKHVSQQN
jgi:hypothetical protein